MRIATMTLMMLVTFCGCAKNQSASVAKESSPLQAGQPGPELHREMTNLMNISNAIYQYACDHGGQLPSSLGQTVTYIQPWTAWTKESHPKWTLKEVATLYISPRDLKGKNIPENPTAAWIDANTSYVYLGRGGNQLPKDLDWGKTVIVHAKVSEGYEVVGPDKQTVRVVPIALLDGHAEAEAVPHTEALIADSIKLLRP